MIRSLLALTTTACLLASAAHAQNTTETDYLTLRAGVFDVDDIYEAAHFGLEYKGMPMWQSLRPIAGIEGNADGGGFVYGGAAYDWRWGESFIVTPSFAVSAYTDGDDSRDLGGVLEFRSGLELGWEFASDHRVGVGVHHLSNAGIYDSNPGTNLVTATYSIPLR